MVGISSFIHLLEDSGMFQLLEIMSKAGIETHM